MRYPDENDEKRVRTPTREEFERRLANAIEEFHKETTPESMVKSVLSGQIHKLFLDMVGLEQDSWRHELRLKQGHQNKLLPAYQFFETTGRQLVSKWLAEHFTQEEIEKQVKISAKEKRCLINEAKAEYLRVLKSQVWTMVKDKAQKDAEKLIEEFSDTIVTKIRNSSSTKESSDRPPEQVNTEDA